MTDSALGLFLRRRSIRSYTNQPVAKELIEIVLQAGIVAPSACNIKRSAWHQVLSDSVEIW